LRSSSYTSTDSNCKLVAVSIDKSCIDDFQEKPVQEKRVQEKRSDIGAVDGFNEGYREIDLENQSDQVHLKWMPPVLGDVSEIALFIFDEFCNHNAFQEVNLSKKIKRGLTEAFAGGALTDGVTLSTVFDDAFELVLGMLKNDSMRRFKNTPAFVEAQTDIRTVWKVHDILHANKDRDKSKVVSCVVDFKTGKLETGSDKSVISFDDQVIPEDEERDI